MEVSGLRYCARLHLLLVTPLGPWGPPPATPGMCQDDNVRWGLESHDVPAQEAVPMSGSDHPWDHGSALPPGAETPSTPGAQKRFHSCVGSNPVHLRCSPGGRQPRAPCRTRRGGVDAEAERSRGSGPSDLIRERTSQPNKNQVSFSLGVERSGTWASWLGVPAGDSGSLHGAPQETAASRASPSWPRGLWALRISYLLLC